MLSNRVRNLALAATAALGLSACTYDGYGGVGVGYGYGGYGGYYDPYYYDDYYPSYYGWWGGYYYPGTGYYVYDRRGYRHRWNDGQRRYWEGRRHYRRDGDRRPVWGGVNRSSQQGTVVRQRTNRSEPRFESRSAPRQSQPAPRRESDGQRPVWGRAR